MRILSLSLEHFRSYPSCTIELAKGDLHVFTGPNGAGKTNIIEAVSLLSFLASSMGADDEDLLRHGAEYYRVRGMIRSDAGEEETLEVVSQFAPRKQKAAFRNDVRLPAGKIVGHLPLIVFLPQDLSLFTGSPSERRRFLDQILSQVSPAYYRALSEYQRAVKQRNTLLRAIGDGRAKERDLVPWDQALAEKGSLLTLARLELLETFSLTLRDELRALGETYAEAQMVYERKGESRELKKLEAELLDLLGRSREKDLLLSQTCVGPHRDDWHVVVDGHDLARVASRGQQRTAVLALLFLESSYVELRRGEKAVILLDDVFSELDADHQERVLESFPGHQVLLTSTHAPRKLKSAVVWDVGEGRVALAR
ncbi:MAG: DNA replication and repair protein RecF [Candidatus Peribacteraceae bacterium]